MEIVALILSIISSNYSTMSAMYLILDCFVFLISLNSVSVDLIWLFVVFFNALLCLTWSTLSCK